MRTDRRRGMVVECHQSTRMVELPVKSQWSFFRRSMIWLLHVFLTKGQSGSMGLYFLQSAYFFQGNANALGSRKLVKFLQEKHDIVIMFFWPKTSWTAWVCVFCSRAISSLVMPVICSGQSWRVCVNSVCLCVCVCACVHACVRACVCVMKWAYPYVFVSTLGSYEMEYHK